MKLIKIIICSVFVFVVNSCKKDKLSGDTKVLAGSWSLTQSKCDCCELPLNLGHNFELVLSEKGNYTLYQDGNKVEHGRLSTENGYVTFHCRDKKKEGEFLNTRKISNFSSDTLIIPLGFCGDSNCDMYVKN